MDIRPAVGVLLLAACGAHLADDDNPLIDSGTPNGDSPSTDGPSDGQNSLGPWGTPAKVPGADSIADEDDGTLSSTRTELIFKRNDAGDANLYAMTRANPNAPWSAPLSLGAAINTAVAEESPRLSNDDMTLYFGRNGDIYKSTRTAVGQPWQAPTAVATLNTADYEKWAAVCDNGYVMVSRSTVANGQDLFDGTLATGATNALTQLNSAANDQGTMLTRDCLGLYFQSNRNNVLFDIYTASRLTTASQWTNPTALTDFNTATYNEEDPWISPDQRTFVFASNGGGNKDLYLSTR
jgi:Tol biopolymer transport system component